MLLLQREASYLCMNSKNTYLHVLVCVFSTENLLKCVNETVPSEEPSPATARDSRPKKAPTPARNTPRVVGTPDRASVRVAAVCVSGPSGPPAQILYLQKVRSCNYS